MAVVHLSDLHFKADRNWLADKITQLSGAVWSTEPSTSLYLILISGDIAFSGKSTEYVGAKAFIDGLLASLTERNGRPEARVVAIPGNHDCNFDRDTDIRRILLDNIWKNIDAFDANGDIANTCLEVQQEFEQFSHNLSNGRPIGHNSLFRTEEIVAPGGFQIVINALNTAWMSSLKEKQGQLLYPPICLHAETTASVTPNLVITMLHHPFNWLAADNARAVRDIIESRSDIVLTGHEHISSTYSKESLSENLLYMEGAVLQNENPGQSGFSVLFLNLETEQQRLLSFEWRSGLYSIKTDFGWRPKLNNRSRMESTIQNTSLFLDQLAELGTGFVHPHRKSALLLKDMFIYPDLIRRSAAPKPGSNPNIDSKDLIDTLYTDRHVMISGASLSGRTALAKGIYTDLRNKYGLKPLLLDGSALSDIPKIGLRKSLDPIVKHQYGADSVERYAQLESCQKAIIVDDFERCGLNGSGQALVIDQLVSIFDFVILLLDQFAALTSLAIDEDTRRVDFEVYEIREFGHYLRGKLIDKWVSLGREHLLSDADRNTEVERLERLVTSLLGRNLLPSNPITILTILQASDAVKGHDPNAGSYGYLYETLILHALSAGNFKPAEIDVIMTFMSLFAAQLLSLDQATLSSSNIDLLTDEYFKAYRMRLPDKLLYRLEVARLIFLRDGQYGFRYPYCYYFFAARYLRDQIQNEEHLEARRQITDMVAHIHYEPYSHIITFYVYLTKDLKTIRLLIESARAIFAEYDPCDFCSDTDFVNRLYKGRSVPNALPTTPIAQNRDEYRRRLDATDEEPESREGTNRSDEVALLDTYSADLPIPVKASMAMRLLNIVGQIVRNSPGSLKAGIKVEVTAEAYALGLRFLNAVLSVQRSGYDELHGYFVDLIREYRILHRKPELLAVELETQADEVIIRYSEALGFAVIRRICQAIGLKELKDIYATVLQSRSSDVSMKLIDLAVRLDVFDNPPLAEAKQINKELRDNFYAHNVFADLIKTYLYLRDVSRSARGELSGLLRMNFDPKRLMNPDRR